MHGRLNLVVAGPCTRGLLRYIDHSIYVTLGLLSVTLWYVLLVAVRAFKDFVVCSNLRF